MRRGKRGVSAHCGCQRDDDVRDQAVIDVRDRKGGVADASQGRGMLPGLHQARHERKASATSAGVDFRPVWRRDGSDQGRH